MFKKTLALLLALLMLTAVFAGCGKKGSDTDDQETETEAATTAETTETETERMTIDYTANTDIGFDDTTIYDDLTIDQLLNPENFQGSDIPEDRDYGGYDFQILADTTNLPYEFVDQSDGDIVKDAVINRQNWIQEYVGVNFVITENAAGYWAMDNFISAIETASGSGTPYDLGLAYCHIPPVVAAKGLSRDLAESENLNLYNTQKEYWGSGIKEEIMIGGRIFWMADSSSWDSVRNLLCVFVNTEFFARANEGYDQTDLYQMVYGGTWTFEHMLFFIQNTYENTNSLDPDEDIEDTYGLLDAVYYYSAENWLYGAGFSLTRLNSKGTYDWTISEQSFVDFSDWWHETLLNNDNILNAVSDPVVGLDVFSSGRAMFTMAPFKIIETELEIDYTVLPLPIYDTNIKNEYSTPILNDYGSWLIPKATKKEAFERSATVLELIAAEGNRRIAPIYFEIYLKRQNAGHDESMQRMFNIIRNAVMFDVGFLYGSVLTYEKPSGGGHEELFIAIRRLWGGNGTGFYSNISTVWASVGASVTAKMNNLMVDILDY